MGNEIERRTGQANIPFGEVIVTALEKLGVGHFVVSPGSRSTPLTLALSTLPKEQVSVCVDERSAAFLALGRIKATRRPVALVCTSGTAGAHYYPAFIEARESGLPLIVLTADRPPELRHCHAGQTIDQLKLFGSYPVFQAELPVPDLDPMLLRQVRELCRRAVEAALGPLHGPVHLNCPFREPFFPNAGDPGTPLETDVLEGLEPVRRAVADLPTLPNLPEKTLILAGPRPWMDHDSEWEALLELSWMRGFPILADGANPIRYHGSESPHVIVHYDRIVRDDAAWAELAPEAVILRGEPPTSKVLRQRLAELDVRGYQIGEGKPGINPIHGRIEWAGASVSSFVDRCRGSKGHYGERWARRDRAMENGLQAAMQEPHPLFEGDVHRLLGEVLPSGSAVFYASSLAIRDAEWFMPRRCDPLLPFSQRGANGIDGTVSLARGIAAGLGSPVWLVTGDLAFLHDANGLLGAGTDDPGVFVVLLNNSGGGIFEFLPVASHTPQFERFFATPQAVDFQQFVQAYGGRHALCPTLEALRQTMGAWDRKGLLVAEIPVDRKASVDMHRKFLKRLGE